jgi:hypothetical protein
MNEPSSRLLFLFRNAAPLIARRSAPRWAGLLAVALGICTLGVSARAAAQPAGDAEAVAKATQLNKEAIAAYQAHKIDDAKGLLKQALDLCDASGLDQHPVKARTLIHVGIVLVSGSKQRDLGIKQFKRALAIEPDIALTKALVTPELQQAFDEAKRGDAQADNKTAEARPETKPAPAATAPEAAGNDSKEETGPAPAAAATEPPPVAPTPPAPPAAAEAASEPPVPSTGLDHEPVTRARPGTAISITVNVENGLKFQKLVLAYRPNGAANFLGREMTQVDPGIYSAEIPARATSGTMVAYYIEAQDENGDPVATRGSDSKPLVVMLGDTRVAKADAKSDDDDDDDDDDDENTSKFFAAISLGSGAGYASGNGDRDTRAVYSTGTIALAQVVHIAPELGYWIRPDILLSIQMRYQIVTGPTEIVDGAGKKYNAANFALAFFAKATWMLGHGSLHPLLSLALGGGQIRHVVKSPIYKDCGADMHTDCIDTIAAGPVLAGAGAGIMYTLTPHVALLAVANTQIGAPNFTFNLDANFGAAYSF